MSHPFSQSKDQGIFETFKGRVSSFIVRRENKTTLQLYASEALSISSTDTHCLQCVLAILKLSTFCTDPHYYLVSHATRVQRVLMM